MKKFSLRFRFLVTSATVVFLLAAQGFLHYSRAGNPVSSGGFTALMLLSLVFFIPANIIGYRGTGRFKTDYARLQAEPAKFRTELDALGKVPLHTMLIFIGFTAVFAIGISLFAPHVVLRPDQRLPLVILCIGMGMCTGSFIYVLGDQTVSFTLLAARLHAYPSDFKYPRQRNKNFIIPFFIAIMTVLCTFSMQTLEVERRIAREAVIDSTMSGPMVAFILVYLTIVGALIALWTSGNSLIYKSLIAQLESLTASEKNLAGRIDISSVDELGFISGRINEFCGGLSDSIISLKGAQTTLSTLGTDLRESAGNSVSAIGQITASVRDVNERVVAQSASVQESSGAVEQIAKNIESLEHLIAEQADSVTGASSSIEEMVGNINSITGSTNLMAERFSSLLSASAEGQSAQSATDARIKQIADRSKTLFEANQVISAIAAQTNLLAMNAAIEAAHAGEAGAGFSVVADEIRKLAETSARQSKNIKSEISHVQSAIDEVVSTSRESETSYSRVVDLITETDGLVREVRQAMTEQKNASMDILEALKNMNTITQQVQSGSHEMNEGNATVLEEVVRLRESTRRIQDSVEEMRRAAEAISRDASRVNELADGTAGTIDLMDVSIRDFRT